MAGARVDVRTLRRMPPPYVAWGDGRDFALHGGAAVRTSADGTFLTPRELDAADQYRIVVSADGFLSETGAWLAAGRKRPLAFPDVVLRHIRTLEGRIVDTQGKPAAGAKVVHGDERNRLSAVAGSDGTFRLEGVLDGPGCLFVEADGFRFNGRAAPPAGEKAAIVLTKDGEPRSQRLKTLAPTLGLKERKALAARVLEPAVRKALAGGKEDERASVLEVLGRADPARALDLLTQETIEGAHVKDALRFGAARGLAAGSVEEAKAVAETIREPQLRAETYLALYDARPADRRDCLAQALLNARAVRAAPCRVILLGRIARRLRDLGDAKRADDVSREGEALARGLALIGPGGHARGVLAGELATHDPVAAVALVGGLKESASYDHGHEAVAVALAATNPAEAERVLGLLGGRATAVDRSRSLASPYDAAAPDVCRRMTVADPGRARRLAARIASPYHKARALGLMAGALANAKPDEATALLREAFATLAAHDGGKDAVPGAWFASAVGLTLVPIAESADSSLATETFWRAVALRAPLRAGERAQELSDQETALLALLAARYDRALARSFLEPLARRAADVGFMRPFLPALALSDAAWAVAVFEALPDGPDKERARPRLASLLLLDGEERWREAQHLAALSHVDDEDI